jgi:ADP-ribose pyrophosphatase YjhB (NUDIX family)
MEITGYSEKHGALGKKRVLWKNRKNYFKMEGVAIVVNYNGTILLGKKRRDSRKFLAGKWHIPAETIEFGEDDKTALRRGIREEAGIEIYTGDYIGESSSPSYNIIRWYECFSLTSKVVTGSDLEDTKWVRKREVLTECDALLVALWPEKIRDYFRIKL